MVLDMNQTDIDEFYTYIPELLGTIRDQKLEYRFQLYPGTVLTFNNRRVLHGRVHTTVMRYPAANMFIRKHIKVYEYCVVLITQKMIFVVD